MKRLIYVGVGLILAATAGCGSNSEAGNHAAVLNGGTSNSAYLLSEEPENVVGVIEARKTTNDGDAISVVGRIGVTANPWVKGRAAFTLLDASLTLVAEGTECKEGEVCSGDCCATERAHATMLVKIVDSQGRVLETDARQLLGVTENEMIIARGKAAKDKSGNVALIADGVYLRR